MLDELQPLNKELSECLKEMLEQQLRCGSSSFSEFTEEDLKVTYLLLDNPLGAPYYILFMIAQEIGARKQVYRILKQYSLHF